MAIMTLRQIFSDIAKALRRKGIDKDSIHPEEYASLIDDISTGDGLSGTFDATAVVSDIASGKTAYVKGELITGTVQEIKSGFRQTFAGSPSVSVTGSYLYISQPNPMNVLLRPNSTIGTEAPLTMFGDATVNDVVSGKTFTSAAGLKITGIYEPSGSGVDTSDATATASDIAKNKTAYVKGKLITGQLTDVKYNSIYTFSTDNSTIELDGAGSFLYINCKVSREDVILRLNAFVRPIIPLTMLGDATAEDVAAGKTFTSSAGFKAVGTATLSSGSDNTVRLYGSISSSSTPNLPDTNSITFPTTKIISGCKKFIIVPRSTPTFSAVSGVNGRLLYGYFSLDGTTVTDNYSIMVDNNGNTVKVEATKAVVTDYSEYGYSYLAITYPTQYRFMNAVYDIIGMTV